MVLTPQLLMNLKLLQLPTLELDLMIRQELEMNPVLEEVEELPEAEASESELAEALPEAVEGETPTPPAEDLIGLADKEKPEVEKLDGAIDAGEIAIADFLQDDGYVPPAMPGSAPDPDRDRFDTAAVESLRLGDVLLPQARSILPPAQVPIAETIIDNLDDDGFLIVGREELARQLGIPQEQVEQVLSVIQHLEEGGIGAGNMREALMLQLEVLGYSPESIEYRLLKECYEAMTRKQYAAIARTLDTTEARVREAIVAIAQLEPRPGRKYNYSNPGYVEPDFCVEWIEGRLDFYPTGGSLPRLRLSRRYLEIVAHPRSYPREQVEFARKKYQNALLLLKGIESRKRTLALVMQHILREQREFFLAGRQHLKPISIKDAGAALHIHPSTISRAVQGKYVETPYAILPMRFFFMTGTAGHARHSVKDMIRRMIEQEDKRQPYSDDQIAELLAKDGIRISRRTVAKYRSEMNTPNCSERRQG